MTSCDVKLFLSRVDLEVMIKGQGMNYWAMEASCLQEQCKLQSIWISKKRRGEKQQGCLIMILARKEEERHKLVFKRETHIYLNFFLYIFHLKYLNFVYSYSPSCMGKTRLQTNAFYSHRSYAYNMLTSLISLMIYFHVRQTFT